VTVHEIKGGLILKDGGVQVRAIPVHHGSWPQAFGYRIDTPERSVVISGDCSPSPALVEAAKGCDVLLHEVYSNRAPERDGHESATWPEYLRQFHTSTAEVAEIAAKSKPKLLVLYHQLLGGETDEVLLEQIRRLYKGPVAVAHDLDVY
jgi:ribonuclease BN (tRNA processing enzyme)